MIKKWTRLFLNLLIFIISPINYLQIFLSENNLFTNFFPTKQLYLRKVRFNSYPIAKIRVLLNFSYIQISNIVSAFLLPRKNPSTSASRRFKCINVAGSFASHVSKVNNAIRVRAKVTGRQTGRADGRRKLFSPHSFHSFSREIRRVSE